MSKTKRKINASKEIEGVPLRAGHLIPTYGRESRIIFPLASSSPSDTSCPPKMREGKSAILLLPFCELFYSHKQFPHSEEE